MLHVTILTLYPQMFPGFLAHSLAGKALQNELWKLEVVNIRDFAKDKHKTVDDTPAGGGAGMVLKPDVMASCIDSLPVDIPRYLMSPRGKLFNQAMAKHLASLPRIMLICGRFEAIDQRVIETRNLEEISLGDFILSGGEAAAFAILDTIIRLLPGTMGNASSKDSESFENSLLEYPQYTKPRIFEDQEIPEVLLGGNHAEISRWRYQESLKLTKQRRPDLYERHKKLHINLDS